jgi:hypothetical protein
MTTDQKLQLLYKGLHNKPPHERALLYAGMLGYLTPLIPDKIWIDALRFNEITNGNQDEESVNNRSDINPGVASTETE